MISIKDYAKSKSISYEAVRKQINRYKDELGAHISKSNRTQYLDDEAVAFLDKKRESNPIIIMQTDDKERIERLENENKALLLKVAELQEQLLQERQETKLLQQQKIELLEAKVEPKKHWWSRKSKV